MMNYSGCVTSAESVLVSLQSHQEVYRTLADKPHITAFLSISPQSLASLSAMHGIEPSTCLQRLRAFFQSKHNFAAVTDTTFARHLSLRETRREYIKSRTSGQTNPILASACPGWVCYAEKTQAQLLPYMSHTKSPQAIQGMLVKDYWARTNGRNLSRDQIYHVAVMPCFDKKLEASRPDFERDGVRDVDCVISTGELQNMLDEAAWDIATQSPTTKSHDETPPLWPELLQHPGTTSGSYMHNVVASLVNSTPVDQLPHLRLDSKNVRGGDHSEHILYDADHKPIFRGAICNGFRNLQNVVRKISPGAPTRRAVVRKRKADPAGGQSGSAAAPERPYDYIEVMACPSGCINGGGQMPPPKREAPTLQIKDEEGLPIIGALPAKEWMGQVEAVYWSVCSNRNLVKADSLHPSIIPFLEPTPDPKLERFSQAVEAALLNTNQNHFQTQFRAVEAPEVNGLAVKW